MSTETQKVALEYIGPPGQVMFDAEGKAIELVAGRRYHMSADLAQFRLARDTRHWKRPDPPKVSAAAKE